MSQSKRSSASRVPRERASAGWVILSHVVGAALIGALDSARLHSAGIAAATVPLFACLGLLIALVSLGAEEIAAGRRWWASALVLAAPSVVVVAPVAATLFDGAYAQTLAVAGAAPYVLPIVVWIAAAAAIALGRHIVGGGDLTSRSIVLLGVAGVLGGLIWTERNVLGTGYPSAHVGAIVVESVLAGLAIRVTHRGVWSRGVSISLSRRA